MYSKKSKNHYHSESQGFLAYCPLCETKYNPLRARILESKEDSHLLHTQCQGCGAYIISLVTSTPFGLSSIGVISDLTASDVLKFKDRPKITANDVIDFYQTICRKKTNK